ncbi:MAG: hypothetical protein JNL08_08025 [Planctomycetes bacterium]|nr:hypothetical protein [Planctomycetota bacterium]
MTDPLADHDVDGALRRAFAPPPAADFAAIAARAAAAAPMRRPWPWLVSAAAVLLLAVAWWWRPAARGTGEPVGETLGAMWIAAYEHAVADGFGGGSCCEPDLDLRQACEQRFAAQLDLEPASVRLLGCYCGPLPTGRCMALLARTDDTPVCVYVLPRAEDPRPRLPADSRFELARRELGEFVLYALSPSASAATLAEFVVP